MSERSINFICITLAVVALTMAGPHRRQSPIGERAFLVRASYPDAKPHHHLFGDLAAVVDIFHINLTAQGKTEDVVAGAVQPNFFQMIGVEPVLGRAFRAGEGWGDREVILSYRLWQWRFQHAAGVVGRDITLEGRPYRVVGILPADFTWNNGETDVWVAYARKSGDAGNYISQVSFDFKRGGFDFEPEI